MCTGADEAPAARGRRCLSLPALLRPRLRRRPLAPRARRQPSVDGPRPRNLHRLVDGPLHPPDEAHGMREIGVAVERCLVRPAGVDVEGVDRGWTGSTRARGSRAPRGLDHRPPASPRAPPAPAPHGHGTVQRSSIPCVLPGGAPGCFLPPSAPTGRCIAAATDAASAHARGLTVQFDPRNGSGAGPVETQALRLSAGERPR